jgi:hypothetical protein
MSDFTLGYLIETGILAVAALVLLGLWLFRPASISPKVSKWASYVIGLAIALVIAFNLVSKVPIRGVSQTTPGGVVKNDPGSVVIHHNPCDTRNALNMPITCFDKKL